MSNHPQPPHEEYESKKARFILIEDHALVRDALRMMLSLHRNLQLVGEADSVKSAQTLLQDIKPDFAIIDVGLPDGDGIELASSLLLTLPELRILILSGDTNPETINRALACGAHCFVPKRYDADELFRAIDALREGGRYVSPQIAQLYQPATPHADPLQLLSAREQEIALLLCDGKSSKHIARELDLSVATVRKHRENIMGKLGVHTAAEVVALVLRHKHR